MEVIDTSTIKQEMREEKNVSSTVDPLTEPLPSYWPPTRKELLAEKMALKRLRIFKSSSATTVVKKKNMNVKTEVTDSDDTGIADITKRNLPESSTSDLGKYNANQLLPVNLKNIHDSEEIDTKAICAPLIKCRIEEILRCADCSFRTLCEEEFRKHVAIHYIEKPFQCQLCCHKSSKKGNLKIHMLKHSRIKRFGCGLCPFKTNYKNSLKCHMKFHVTDMSERDFQKDVAVRNVQKLFQCQVCRHETNLRASLNIHMLKHNRIKRFSCHFCPFKTSYKNSLKYHVKGHTESNKQYNCIYCSFKSKCEKQYDLHVLSHSAEKFFYCDRCSFKTLKNSEHREHVMAHKNPFKCPLCQYENGSKSLISAHILQCCVFIRPRREHDNP